MRADTVAWPPVEIVRSVVQQKMAKIRRSVGAGGRERSHPHQGRTIAVERERPADPGAPTPGPRPAAARSPWIPPCRAGWPCRRRHRVRARKKPVDAKNRRGAHGGLRHHLAQSLAARRPCFRCDAGRRDDGRRRCRSIADAESPGGERIRGNAALLHQQGVGSAGAVHVRRGAIQRRSDGAGVGRKQFPRNLHGIQHGRSDRAHQCVLRLVGDSRLSSPRDDQQLRKTKRPRQRGERADGVTQSRILHHRDAPAVRHAPAQRRSSRPCERHAGHQRHRVAFIRHGDIVQRFVLQHIVDERREIGAGNSRIPVETPPARRLDKVMRFNQGPARRGAAPMRCRPASARARSPRRGADPRDR